MTGVGCPLSSALPSSGAATEKELQKDTWQRNKERITREYRGPWSGIPWVPFFLSPVGLPGAARRCAIGCYAQAGRRNRFSGQGVFGLCLALCPAWLLNMRWWSCAYTRPPATAGFACGLVAASWGATALSPATKNGVLPAVLRHDSFRKRPWD